MPAPSTNLTKALHDVADSVYEKSAFQSTNHSPAVALDFHKLPGLDGFEGSEASGYEGKEVFETTRLRAKNDDGDLSVDQILLLFDTLSAAVRRSPFFRPINPA